jgi:MFS family permease
VTGTSILPRAPGKPAIARSSRRAVHGVLAAVCLGQLMVTVDSTIVTVALPSIQSDLHASRAGVTWIVNSYLITSAGLLLLAGRVSDLAGRRRVFLIGLALFMLASFGCGIADSQAALIVARCAQGVAGAIVSSGVVAIIAAHYPGRSERARAMSMYALVISAGASAGVILGGMLTELLNWHWIFFINLPLGLTALALARTLIPPIAA